ncbi:MAG: hypothetical protein ABFS14_01980 [Gemmatimonadota bacterium]
MRIDRLLSVVCAAFAASCTSAEPTVTQSPPTREVRGQDLISSDLPALVVRLDSSFSFLGTVPFVIPDFADGERFVFVDSDDETVRRTVIAQFETAFPGPDNTYNYSFSETPVVAGYNWRSNPFAFSYGKAAADNPDGEAALTAAFLRSQGYEFADEVMLVRHLTVPDSARKHELILFYIEPAESAGVGLADLYDGDFNETPLFDSLAVGLASRADEAFEILPLQERFEP